MGAIYMKLGLITGRHMGVGGESITCAREDHCTDSLSYKEDTMFLYAFGGQMRDSKYFDDCVVLYIGVNGCSVGGHACALCMAHKGASAAVAKL